MTSHQVTVTARGYAAVLRMAADVAPTVVAAPIADPLAAWLRGHADYIEAVPCSADRDAIQLALAIIDAAKELPD
jgi:hypothetical protein